MTIEIIRGKLRPEQEELRQLREEVKRLKMEKGGKKVYPKSYPKYARLNTKINESLRKI